MVSYSPCISCKEESILYFLDNSTPFFSRASNFLKYLNFSRRSSSLDNFGSKGIFWSGFTGMSLNFAKPSQVLLPESVCEVDCPIVGSLSLNRTPGFSSKKLLGEENKSDLGLKLFEGISSTKLFNSFSKLFKSSNSMSLVGFPPSLTLSFINNSRPPPKLEELPKPSLLRSKSVSSIMSSIISIHLIE